MSGHGILPASCNLWVCRSCRVYHFENPFSVTAQALQDYHQSTTRPSEYDASVALHSRHSDPLNDGSDMSGEIQCLVELLVFYVYQYGASEFTPTVNGGPGAISSSGKSRDVIGRSTGPTVDYRLDAAYDDCPYETTSRRVISLPRLALTKESSWVIRCRSLPAWSGLV
jgi:hypothetical protein